MRPPGGVNLARNESARSAEREDHPVPKVSAFGRYREKVAREKRLAYRDWDYWGKPVPGFGDPRAKLLILGLAPAAHGGNRTGRVFTGDRSGDFLYNALYDAGFANQPTSTRRDDGLILKNAYVAATVRCAPPANKPLPSEEANCRPYFEKELELLRPRAILALGGIAMRAYLGLLKERGRIKSAAAFPFRHGASYEIGTGCRACSFRITRASKTRSPGSSPRR